MRGNHWFAEVSTNLRGFPGSVNAAELVHLARLADVQHVT